MANVKEINFDTDIEAGNAIGYVLSALVLIPSMRDKLPNHIYYRLEGLERYAKSKGVSFIDLTMQSNNGYLVVKSADEK